MFNVTFPDTSDDGQQLNISEEAKDLVLGLMRSNPLQRFTVQDVKQHPWFAGTDWSAVENRQLEPSYCPLETTGAYFITKNPVLL